MKTEDEIAREKDAVQKMIGAKGAMETAIKRIERLENTISQILSISDDMAEKIGENLSYRTFYHGTRAEGAQFVGVQTQLRRIGEIGRTVK
jgi:hypothetical protein